MSQRTASRELLVNLKIVPPRSRTLLDVRAIVMKCDDIDPRQRADCISAINSLGKIHLRPGETDLERALAAIEADPIRLVPHMDGIGHVKAGLGKASWANVRSRVRKALRIAGINIANRRRQSPLLPEWDQIFSCAPAHPFKSGLGGFVTWCSEAGVLPQAVTQLTFDAYSEYVSNSRIRKDAHRTLLLTRRTWNQATTAVAGWPQQTLTIKHRLDHRYAIPLSSFGEGFAAEVMKWRDAALNPDLLDEASPPPIREVTADGDQYRLQRMASALVAATGRDPKSITSIADLVEIENAKTILLFLVKRMQGKTPHAKSTENIFLLARFMVALAKNWVKLPEDKVDKLRGIARKLKPPSAGMRPKNRAMLQAFENKQLLAQFLELPYRIFGNAKRKGQPRQRDAVRLGTAFAISLLSLAPVRPKNAVSIRLDRHIIQTGSGASRRVHLHFDEAEVKNGVSLEFEITGGTLELFDYYVSQVRPLLAGPDNPYLFPGQGAGGKVASWFSSQIAEFLTQELGQRVTAHQFRHLIGYIFLLKNPGNYETVRRLLGHRSIETTVNFYAGMSMPQAAKAVDAALQEMRTKLSKSAPVSKRRGKH